MDLDKMTSDLHSEKSNALKSENARVLIEKQNRELRDKLAELEELAKGRSKSAVTNLEAKIAALDNQLQVESHERQNATRLFKKSEQRVRALQTQIEEEHKNGDGLKEQVKN
jgi:myosin protein heavy chain